MTSTMFGIELIRGEFVAALLFGSGTVLALYGLVKLFRCDTAERAPASNFIQSNRRSRRSWVTGGLLALIVVSGAFFRADGLDSKTLTHPESYVPGIELPEDFAWPPPRLTFFRTLSWHWHSETHPPGYYYFMWAWTKLFGSSLYVLRLPSVLFGLGSIVLIFSLAAQLYDRSVALLSAGLLAFNGFHIYWSQHARMYSMGCFLGLLSTVLLLQMARDTNHRAQKEGLYVAVSLLGLMTQLFFWPLLVGQIIWTTLRGQQSDRFPRVMFFQALVVMLSSVALTHAVYVGDDQTLPSPTLTFIQQFLSFGFLFEPDYFSIPAREVSPALALLLVLVAIWCAGRGLWDKPENRFVPPEAGNGLTVKRLLPVAAGSSLMILGLTTLGYRRQSAMALTAAVPMLAVLMPQLLHRAGRAVRRAFAGAGMCPAIALGSLTILLAVVPFLTMVGMSFWISVIAQRPFLLFVPYLLVLIAAGVKSLSRRATVGIPVAVLLVLAHGSSIAHFRRFPADQIDYQSLARSMAERIKPGDLIFVRHRDYVPTPLYYYLDSNRYQFIAGNFIEAVSKSPQSRVWLLMFDSARWGPFKTTTEEMYAALDGFYLDEQVEALRGRGLLYVRSSASAIVRP